MIAVEEIPGGFFLIHLEDSVFYAESGGQPSDNGCVNGLDVLEVSGGDSSKGVKVKLNQPLAVDDVVSCEIDWDRRFDFMQQHTGQHLISAIANSMFAAETVRWELGKEMVSVDLMLSRSLTEEDVSSMENAVNEQIRANRMVECKSYDISSFDKIPFKRGEPKGAASNFTSIRVVTIDGLDSNPCGGTHVRSLSELQVAKIIGVQRDRGATRVLFIVGNRVLKSLHNCLNREKRLTATLTLPPKDHVDAVDALLKDKRNNAKTKKLLLEELAILLAQRIVQSAPLCPAVIVEHIPGADLAFLQSVSDTVCSSRPEDILFLSGDDSNCFPEISSASVTKKKKTKNDSFSDTYVSRSGPFVLLGPPEKIGIVKEYLMLCIGGRGGGRGGGRPGKIQGTFDLALVYGTSPSPSSEVPTTRDFICRAVSEAFDKSHDDAVP